MSKKLTPWFAGNVKPARIGYYQRDWPASGLSLDYWTGKGWRNTLLSGRVLPVFDSRQNVRWRGLAEKP